MNALKVFLALVAGLALCGSEVAMAQVAVPPLTARVTDQTGTLTGDQVSELEQTLQAFESRKGTQIAVLIVPTTAPETIEQYSMRVVEQWKLGRKQVDDGALLIVAKMTVRCASRSVTAWRVRSLMQPVTGSSTKLLCRGSGTVTSLAGLPQESIR